MLGVQRASTLSRQLYATIGANSQGKLSESMDSTLRAFAVSHPGIQCKKQSGSIWESELLFQDELALNVVTLCDLIEKNSITFSHPDNKEMSHEQCRITN
jgi:hypothetical protein